MCKKFMILSLLLCSVSNLFACKNTVAKNNIKIEYENIDISDIDNDKMLQQITLMKANVFGNEKIKDTINRINGNIMTLATKFKNDNYDEVRDLVAENPNALYEYNVILNNSYRDNKYFVLVENTYAFTMGAHGGTTLSVHNINLETGSELKILDIIKNKNDFKNQLMTKLLAIRDEYNLFDDFEDTVDKYMNGEHELTFSIAKDSVDVTFQQYDIAPYASGIITIEMDKKLFSI